MSEVSTETTAVIVAWALYDAICARATLQRLPLASTVWKAVKSVATAMDLDIYSESAGIVLKSITVARVPPELRPR